METERDHDHGEAGFTLVEVLVVVFLALIVIGLPLGLAVSSFKAQNESASRTASASRAQLGLDRLVRDLRQATAATVTNTAAAAQAVLTVPTQRASSAAAPSLPRTVVWTCTVGATCTRQEDASAAVQLIPGVTAASFTPTFGASTVSPIRVDVSVTAQVLDEQRRAGESLESSGTTGPGVPVNAVGQTLADAVTYVNGVDLRNVGT